MNDLNCLHKLEDYWEHDKALCVEIPILEDIISIFEIGLLIVFIISLVVSQESTEIIVKQLSYSIQVNKRRNGCRLSYDRCEHHLFFGDCKTCLKKRNSINLYYTMIFSVESTERFTEVILCHTNDDLVDGI